MASGFPQICSLLKQVPSRAKAPRESSYNGVVKSLQSHKLRALPLLSQMDNPPNSLAQRVAGPCF